MVTLQSLQANERTVKVNLEGVGTLTVAYRPAVATPNWYEAMREQPLAAALAMLVKSWDLMDGANMVPLTPEDINASVPTFVQMAVWAAVLEDLGKLSRAAI